MGNVRGRRHTAMGIAGVAAWSISLVSLLTVLWFVVPAHERVLRELEVTLPPPTIVVLQLARFAKAYWFCCIPVIGLAVLVSALVYARRGGVGRAFWILAALTVVVCTLAVFVVRRPVSELQEAIGPAEVERPR